MKKIVSCEARGHGQFLLMRFADDQGKKHDLAFGAAQMNELLRYITGALVNPEAPEAIRAVIQVLAAREVKVSTHGAATPVLIQELEAGVTVVTTIEREALQQLRDDCDRVLESLPPMSAH